VAATAFFCTFADTLATCLRGIFLGYVFAATLHKLIIHYCCPFVKRVLVFCMDYIKVHEKWREFWRTRGTNAYDPKGKGKPYYCLEMFSYPSGASLHMGHYFNFAPSDTHARFKRMCGFNVFQPMGFDAFGLPAENHALKTDTHPADNTEKNMQIMRRQLEELGGMYDWNYSVVTCSPEYYKWTQWLFVKLFKRRHRSIGATTVRRSSPTSRSLTANVNAATIRFSEGA